jgi:dephospho-CoA kinase
LVKSIKDAFGWDAYTRSNELNREYLAKIVFNNQEKLDILNSIVHPKVGKDYEQWTIENRDKPYSIKEAALLFEAKSYKFLHKIIVVTCPIDILIDRILKRDHVKREDVLKRISKQMTDKERLEKADYVILNDGKKSLIEQTLAIHNQILELRSKEAVPLKS